MDKQTLNLLKVFMELEREYQEILINGIELRIEAKEERE